ncbi:MAG: DUF933 domain-containing protein [Myxococcota bacterium]
MDVGIVGRAGSGRTTLFRALLAHRVPRSGSGRQAGGAVGSIHVQDPRLDRLAQFFRPEKRTPIEIRVHDLCPSLEPSFPTAEIEAMKRMDVLLGVVPGFADASSAALEKALAELLEELYLEDLTAIERRIERAARDKLPPTEHEALEIARTTLEAERPVRLSPLNEPQRRALRGYALVSDRPLIVVLNAAEEAAGASPPEPLQRRAAEQDTRLITICAALEAEMAELPEEERLAFLAEYGVTAAAGPSVTRAILETSHTVPFFTVGEDECRAWGIPRGTRAREAAGKIHSDIERGFIRAEVIAFDELEALAAEGHGARSGAELLAEARKRGKLRLEGRDYVVQDGEIVHFRFNV